ncbi:ATP-dependent DNA ligase [Streptomyces sp. NPDC086080]|uniref:ATP-dependent DNA ligase n=1 Tax=Streptomyces sp. NPDC086080 TaxID=3365748 RepID=UPI0037CED2B9
MIELPAEPMLATPVETFALPSNWFAEPKWDGFRAFAARVNELVVREETRLAFERLTQRLHRRGAAAQRAATVWPAHYVAFDLHHLDGWSLLERPYVERRCALKDLFRQEGLSAPWTLCPSTNDAEVARGWLTWSAAGVESCVFKDSGKSYRPGARS